MSLPPQLLVEIIYGAQYVEADDIWRANQAGQQYFDNLKLDFVTAYAEYIKQLDELGDERKMTGLAQHWVLATADAQKALTAGWGDPTGAGCSLYVK